MIKVVHQWSVKRTESGLFVSDVVYQLYYSTLSEVNCLLHGCTLLHAYLVGMYSYILSEFGNSIQVKKGRCIFFGQHIRHILRLSASSPPLYKPSAIFSFKFPPQLIFRGRGGDGSCKLLGSGPNPDPRLLLRPDPLRP
jgi:hypothetical protein